MRIICDTREQAPYNFTAEAYAGTVVEIGKLEVGDYAPAGLGDKCSVERKSLADLIMCLSTERDRFERELQRAAPLDAFCVVVEASWEDMARGNYRSRMTPHSACQSILAFGSRYRTAFFFAGSRSAAEYITHGFIRQYLESAKKRWGSIVRAHGTEAS